MKIISSLHYKLMGNLGSLMTKYLSILSLQIPDTDMIRFHWLNTEEELRNIVEHAT